MDNGALSANFGWFWWDFGWISTPFVGIVILILSRTNFIETMDVREKKAKAAAGTVTTISYLFIMLFVYAAVSKLLDFETFTVQLAQSPLLSAYAGVIAWAVPGIEIFIALLLAFPKVRTFGLYAAFTLMVMFTGYIYIILNFSDFIPCSCGGVLEKLSWTQHLVFNVAFIVLATAGLFLSERNNWKRKLVLLVGLAIIGMSIVSLLFVFSEKKMHRNNAFQRRYMPHPIEKIHSFDLKYNSYYIAGIENGKVYLGNSTAPLLMTIIDSSFVNTTTTMIKLDQMDLPYRSAKVLVAPPLFYVADGTVPVVLQGDIVSWEATTKMYGDYYFNHIIYTYGNKLAVQSSSGITGENIFGIIDVEDSTAGIFSDQILDKQLDGIFGTDGRLVYSQYLNKLIFMYYYRNEYLLINMELEEYDGGKTIDTISKPQLHIAENPSNGQRKLGGNTILVNRTIATENEILLVDSPRLGKLEPKKMLDDSNLIDVYDLSDQSYKFSFYLYKHEGSKMREFVLDRDVLYALQGDHIVAYKLRSNYFN